MKKIGKKERVSSLWIIILTIIVDFIGIGIIIPLLPFYSKLFGATPIILGVLVAASSLMQFILSPVIGKMSDKIGRRPIIIGTLIISILGHVTFVFANSIYILLISRLLLQTLKKFLFILNIDKFFLSKKLSKGIIKLHP